MRRLLPLPICVMLGAAVVLFANSSRGQTLAQSLDAAALVWTTGGTSGWVGQTSVAYDAVDAAASGTITHNQESWIQTTTTNGPGVITFWWKTASLAPDGLEFSVNGVTQDAIAGAVEWCFRSFSVPAGTNTLRWRYFKDSAFNAQPDKGWLDQVIYTTGVPPALQEAVNTCGVAWASGGNTNITRWNAQTNVTHDGSLAAQSGAIFNNQESWLETTVSGVTNISFWWKVSSDDGFDFLEFYRDTTMVERITGEIGWQQKSFALTPNTHTLRWRYFKDDVITAGSDRGWLDQVTFSPPLRALPYALSAPVRLSDGRMQLAVSGEVGCACSVLYSTNLAHWLALSNFTTTAASRQIVDDAASNSVARFYRVLSP